MAPGAGWRAAAVGWALLIVLSGVLPTQGAVHAVSGGRDSMVTTAGHVVAYVVLGFLLPVAIGGWEARVPVLVLAFVLASGLGIAVEAVQALLPYRDAQSLDALGDIAGAVVGLVLFSGVARVRRPRSRRG